MKVNLSAFIYLNVIFLLSLQAAAASLTINSIHRTAAATERVNTLWCYGCSTMDNGEICVDVLQRNDSSIMHKCQGQDFICMVKRFSYTTSTENSTSPPKMWSMDRRCTQNCEPGCIVIGERTKLYACTSCCEDSLCNYGTGAASRVCDRVKTGIGTRFWLVLLLPQFLSSYQR